MLDFVVLATGAFFRTVLHGVLQRYGSAGMRYESGFIRGIGSLDLRCRKLMLSVGLFRLIEEYDVDLVLG